MKESNITETHMRELSDINKITSGFLHINQKTIPSVVSEGIVIASADNELLKQSIIMVASFLRQLSKKSNLILGTLLVLVAIILEKIANALPDKEIKPKKTKEKGELENV